MHFFSKINISQLSHVEYDSVCFMLVCFDKYLFSILFVFFFNRKSEVL